MLTARRPVKKSSCLLLVLMLLACQSVEPEKDEDRSKPVATRRVVYGVGAKSSTSSGSSAAPTEGAARAARRRATEQESLGLDGQAENFTLKGREKSPGTFRIELRDAQGQVINPPAPAISGSGVRVTGYRHDPQSCGLTPTYELDNPDPVDHKQRRFQESLARPERKADVPREEERAPQPAEPPRGELVPVSGG